MLSFARCGPSALAPSTPMLLPDTTHTHNHTVVIDETVLTDKNIMCVVIDETVLTDKNIMCTPNHY